MKGGKERGNVARFLRKTERQNENLKSKSKSVWNKRGRGEKEEGGN